jgi:hypothetical protein
MSTIISADSHMCDLDENVLKYLSSELHEPYLRIRGPHRRPGLTPADPGPAGEWDPSPAWRTWTSTASRPRSRRAGILGG